MEEPDEIEISTEELEALLACLRSVLAEEDYQKLAAVVRTLGYVTKLLENREATLDTLRRAGISKSEIARRLQIGRTSVRRILAAGKAR